MSESTNNSFKNLYKVLTQDIPLDALTKEGKRPIENCSFHVLAYFNNHHLCRNKAQNDKLPGHGYCTNQNCPLLRK